MCKVYIRMCAYNAEKTIRRAIKSVLKQTHSDFIFYICDNGSSDRTRKIIDFYAKKDSRIVPFYNQENKVFNEASIAFRDLPRLLAANDYYCTLGAADEYVPSFLEDMLAFVEENGLDIACCGTEMFQVDRNENRTSVWNRVLPENLVLDASQFGEYYPQYYCFMYSNGAKLFKGSTTYDMVTDPNRVSSWPRAYGEDAVISFQALRHARRMGVLGKVLHRSYTAPLASQFLSGRVLSDRILFEDALDFLGQYGPVSVQNYSFIYAAYLNALIDTVRVLMRSSASSVEKLDTIMDICNCVYTIRLASWTNMDENTKNRRKRLFSEIVQWMLSLEEVPDEKAEEFFKCGEFAAAAAEQAGEWITFKKLKIAFFLQNQREEEAQAIISELNELDAYGEHEETEDRLQDETNLSRYLDLLRFGKERYTIFIAACDTPWGPHFTPELTAKLVALGLKVNLYGKFRYAYVAVLDQGKRIFEQIPPDTGGAVVWNGKIDEIAVSMESRGFGGALPKARIELDGQNHSASLRGLNIVVYDKGSACVVDSVNFDTWADALTCTRTGALARKLTQWHSAHPEIGLLCFNKPDFPSTHLTETEQFIVENVHSQGDSYRLIDHPKLPLRRFFTSKEDILESCKQKSTPKMEQIEKNF